MNPINSIFLAIGAALGLVIVVAVLWLCFANAHLKTQLAQAQANDTACHMANDDFAATVARQNKAVEDLKAESAARQKQALVAAAEAEKSAQEYFLQAKKMRAVKMRAVKMRGDVCKATDDLFNSYLGIEKPTPIIGVIPARLLRSGDPS